VREIFLKFLPALNHGRGPGLRRASSNSAFNMRGCRAVQKTAYRSKRGFLAAESASAG